MFHMEHFFILKRISREKVTDIIYRNKPGAQIYLKGILQKCVKLEQSCAENIFSAFDDIQLKGSLPYQNRIHQEL